MNIQNRFHIVGICGVATSALAIALHKRGMIVSGSDKGFFPPVSTELEKQGVHFYAGWHVEKMLELGKPDVVIVGTASGTSNPETIYAKENNILIYSFAQAIGEFFAKQNSIVCSGTWGKTSSSALLSYIMLGAGMDPSYMFGGVSLSHKASAALDETDWSVFEGDEYKSSPTDNTAKFMYYKATHLLLSAVSWDHADLYPTEQSYFDAFNKLISGIPATGLVVACKDHAGARRVAEQFQGNKVWYGRSGSGADFEYLKVQQDKQGLTLSIIEKSSGVEWLVKSPMLGLFQSENITGCFAMARSIGIEAETIISSIASFKGLRRRLEKRYEGKVTIFDDIAHSPEKARATLSTLRSIYSGEIIAVFEPNSGGRSPESAPKYENAFNDADIVVIPRLTSLKIKSDDKGPAPEVYDADALAEVISKTHREVGVIVEDDELVDFLIENAQDEGDVIAFLGSHGFRNMIEETVKRFVSKE